MLSHAADAGTQQRPVRTRSETFRETGKGLSRPARCLVVDGSEQVAAQLGSALSQLAPGVFLLPPIKNGAEPFRAIRDCDPDLLFLDLDMPRMGGLTTLRALGQMRPARVIVLAPETLEGGRAAWEALGLGVYDFLPMKVRRGGSSIDLSAGELRSALFRAIAPFAGLQREGMLQMRTRPAWIGEVEHLPYLLATIGTHRLMRLARFLSQSGSDLRAALLITVPHPPRFTKALVEGLNRVIRHPVRIAASGERLSPHHIFLVPGGATLRVRRVGFDYTMELQDAAGGEGNRRFSIPAWEALTDCPGGEGGLLLADRPDRTIEHLAGKLVRDGRLFLLKAPAPGEGRLPRLHAICPLHRLARLRK